MSFTWSSKAASKMSLVSSLALFLIIITLSTAQRKRCYSCRSRGPLGDCKDPFEFNSTTVEQTGVEAQPCASGWCGKSIEGEDEGQHLMATERMCLQRPPSDNKERCAQTFYGNRKKTFFMCFCRGDLCNGTDTATASLALITFCCLLFKAFQSLIN